MWDCEERIDDAKELLLVLSAKVKEKQNKENSQADYKKNMMNDYRQKLAALEEKSMSKNINMPNGVTSK